MGSDSTAQTRPVFIPRSHLTTESNKTGSWRFLRPKYEEKTAPCSAACPAGEDIGRIEMLTAQGLFKEAWETILQENPFPGVCGRVCFHPCEQVCNRGPFDEPIAIHHLERFLAETAARYALAPELPKLPAKPQKVAIVGAGPSGLAAGYFLNRLGYTCDVFEATSEPGGVLRWGIPAYRLPPAVLQAEIEYLTRSGLNIHCHQSIARDFLQQAAGTYDAVYLGCGQASIPPLRVPGEDCGCLVDGLNFLRAVNRGEAPVLNGTVAVIGGGNTAIDVARSAVRLGAKPILIYRRRRQDMPAFADEVQMALEEGVELLELTAVSGIEPRGDGYALTLQELQMTGVDAAGRACTEPLANKTGVLEVSRLFTAIGLQASEDWFNPPGVGERVLRLPHAVLSCAGPGPAVVYGGDLTNAIKSVVHAVASGKEAAIALDSLFQEGFAGIEARMSACAVGSGPSLSMEIYMQGPRCQRSSHIVRYEEINTDYFQLSPRVVQPRLLREERVRSFAEIELKISAGLAIREAERCFNCGLCNQCDNCRLFCPDLAVKKDAAARGRHIDYDYCKGCGICVVECPRNAMALEEEQ